VRRIGAEDVRHLVAEGEGSRVEFKRGLPRPSKVARTLAAFANTRGGALLIGVDDDGSFPGAPHPRATAETLADIARAAVDPPLEPRVSIVSVDGARIVVAEVGLSPDRPHHVVRENGTREAPIRVGSSTRAARGPSLAALTGGDRRTGLSGLSELEREVLHWIGSRTDPGRRATGRCTPAEFARSRNIGVARARRAFVHLERAGYLVAYGQGAGRSYARA